MSAGYLLDTSAAILIRDAPASSDTNLLDLPLPPALSIITRVELEGGLGADRVVATQRRALLDEMLAMLRIIDFDGPCADAYRTIIATCGYSRRKVADRMIAATALAHDLALITANPSDFRDVPGLDLIGW